MRYERFVMYIFRLYCRPRAMEGAAETVETSDAPLGAKRRHGGRAGLRMPDEAKRFTARRVRISARELVGTVQINAANHQGLVVFIGDHTTSSSSASARNSSSKRWAIACIWTLPSFRAIPSMRQSAGKSSSSVSGRPDTSTDGLTAGFNFATGIYCFPPIKS